LRKFFLTVGYSGLFPKGPGTAGTIAALPIGVYILTILPPSTLFLLSILISIIATKQIDIFEKEGGEHDDKTIVIDELVGMWFALSISIQDRIVEFTDEVIGAIVLSFILFRVLDIWKPSIIGRIDRNVRGGLGVMGDDIVAGLFAGLISASIIGIYRIFV
jgi:phosphatidylglycerophosphatase A